MADSEVESKPHVTLENDVGASSINPKLDPHGFALRPQPSDDPMGT